jgi:hypothetical protein
MKSKTLIVAVIALVAVVQMTAIVPCAQASPTVITDTWFVLVRTTATDNPTWNDGVVHNTYTVDWNLMRSPSTSGSVQIGTAKSQGTLDFNNITKQGYLKERFTLNFTDSNSTRNPYGVGTLEADLSANLVALHPVRTNNYGNGTGFLLATQGTGAFSNAMIAGNVVLSPLQTGPTTITEALFFGTHPRVNGMGRLETDSLKGTYRDWKVLQFDGRVYLVPPATFARAPLITSIGTWDEAYYSRIGMTVMDVAKLYVDMAMS